MNALSAVLGLGAVLFSISAWHVGSDMAFWNLSHTITFTLLPTPGFSHGHSHEHLTDHHGISTQ